MILYSKDNYNKWKREDCPYPKESQESIDWLDGWDETAFYGGWE
jgi:ribosome modulation factor